MEEQKPKIIYARVQPQMEDHFEKLEDGTEKLLATVPHVHQSTNPVTMEFGGTMQLPNGARMQTKIGSGRFCDGCGVLFWVPMKSEIPIIGQR